MACFKGIHFLTDGDVSDASLLEDNGAKRVSEQEVPGLASPVYLVTSDYHAPLSLTCQQMAHVQLVSPAWIQTSLTRGRLQDPKLFSPDPRQFFTGVVICCSELPTGDKEAIYGGVSALGGAWNEELTKAVTHMAALTLNSAKCKRAMSAGIQVVLPHWIDDCLRLRRRIPSEPYTFPEPKIFETNLSDGAPRATQDNFDHLKDFSFELDALKLATEEDIFGGKRVYLADDLELGDRLKATTATVLANANAKLSDTLRSADIYIGRFRQGKAYKLAACANKIIGNWAWLYYCLAKGRFSSPMDNLLHYPVPAAGLPEFNHLVFTVSNYTGVARTFLEQLITILGGTYTRSMLPTHTHLITALEAGEKFNTAKLWNVECANHLWLEDCYAKWMALPCTIKSYQHWPRETHLMDVVGSTPLAMEGLLPFFEDELEEEQAQEAVMPSSRTVEPAAASSPTPVLQPIQLQHNTPVQPRVSPPGSRHSTSRKASQAAASKLRDSMQDANKHALELKRKHPDSATPRKRVKEAAASKRLLLTGCPEMTAAMEQTLAEMGVTIVEQVAEATHLVAPRLARTKKFITAMPIADSLTFVNWDWLVDGVKTRKLAREQLYPMTVPEDQDWAEQFTFATVKSAAKALRATGGLLQDCLVHVSDAAANVGGFDTYRDIVTANGGQCTLFGKRHEVQCARRLMIVLDAQDPALTKWRRESKKTAAAAGVWPCFDREWLMQSAMRQVWIEGREMK